LAFIYYFKGFLSIGDIQVLLSPLSEKYFTEEHDELDKIYNEIVKMERLQLVDLFKEIPVRAELAGKSFKNVSEGERDYLQLFSFICMLSFDVYVKKQMIEQIIDEMREDKNPDASEKEK
jgi:hypothetical protein